MPSKRMPGIPAAVSGGRKVCPLCWKPADKRDATLNGYHIECAKEAAEIICDAMHSKRGIVYRRWYAARYPGRPIPGVALPSESNRKEQ